MKFRTLGKTGWNVSAVGMGCWGLGGQFGEISEQQAIGTLDAAFDAGCNFFDTADQYGVEPGTSEMFIGKWLKERRDKVCIATKVGNWAGRQNAPLQYTHPLHIINCCHASLHRLQTDHIDVYQCHLGHPENPDIFLEAFAKLKEQGKIREFGISTNHLESLKAFNKNGDCAMAQVGYNMLRRDAEKDALPYCLENNIGVILRDPLGKGTLTGKFTQETVFTDQIRIQWNEGERQRDTFLKTLEFVEKVRSLLKPDRTLVDIALQFTHAHPAVTCPIPGMKSVEQARANCAAADGELSEEEVNQIKALSDNYR